MKLGLGTTVPKPRVNAGNTTPGGARHVYVRPDGVSIYLRPAPNGSDTYVRP